MQLNHAALQASLRAESREALAVLERHVPELRAILAQQGFASAELDLGLADPGERWPNAEPDGRGAPRGRGATATDARASGEPAGAIDLARALARADGLDLWA